MGGLVSRRRRFRVEARSVSTQATESKSDPGAVHRATAVDETRKAAATELDIGDGFSPTRSSLHHHTLPFRGKTNPENKKRRGLSKVKVRPRSGKKALASGIDFSTQYDFLALPGQVVSPTYTRPVQQRGPLKDGGQLGSSTLSSGDPKPTTDLVTPTVYATTKDKLSNAPKSPKLKFYSTTNTDTADNKQPAARKVGVVYTKGPEDENSNVLTRGSLSLSASARTTPESRPNASICQHTQDLPRVAATVPVRGIDMDCQTSPRSPSKPGATSYPPALGVSATSQDSRRRKAAAYSADQARSRPGSRVVGGQEFRFSLEEIFQGTVPCHPEVMEVGAVTGTNSATECLPPTAGYPACWSGSFSGMCPQGDEGNGPGWGRPPDPPSAHLALDTGQSCVVDDDNDDRDDDNEGSDFAEDTLDWNVDDRVRSPSDPRTDSDDHDDDPDTVDVLKDCTIDLGPRNCRPVGMADQDMEGPQSPLTSPTQPSGGGDIQDTKTQTNDADSTKPQSIPSTEGLDGKQATSLTHAEESKNREGANPNQEKTKKLTPEDETEGKPTEDKLSEDKVPEDKNLVTKNGGLLADEIKAVCVEGEVKPLLAMQEAEAMTLLLLTGSLPGEEGIRGAGDAQTLDSTTDLGQAGDLQGEEEHTAELAAMLEAQSKSSCQLQQLQSPQAPPDRPTQTSPHGPAPPSAPPDDAEERRIPDNREAGSTADPQAEAPKTNDHSAPQEVLQRTGSPGAASASERSQQPAVMPQPSIQPASGGAASCEADWEVIPLHRVLGHTDLGASAAGGLSLSPDPLVSPPTQGSALLMGLSAVREGQASGTEGSWPLDTPQAPGGRNSQGDGGSGQLPSQPSPPTAPQGDADQGPDAQSAAAEKSSEDKSGDTMDTPH